MVVDFVVFIVVLRVVALCRAHLKKYASKSERFDFIL